MTERKRWITSETRFLCVCLAAAIHASTDEKTALKRICDLLRRWDFEIDPSELGSTPADL